MKRTLARYSGCASILKDSQDFYLYLPHLYTLTNNHFYQESDYFLLIIRSFESYLKKDKYAVQMLLENDVEELKRDNDVISQLGVYDFIQCT